MSYIFEIGDSIVWEPSHNTARVFLCQLALAEDISGISAGISEVDSDTAKVDIVQLREFVTSGQALLSKNMSMSLLFHGTFAHLCALLLTSKEASAEACVLCVADEIRHAGSNIFRRCMRGV